MHWNRRKAIKKWVKWHFRNGESAMPKRPLGKLGAFLVLCHRTKSTKSARYDAVAWAAARVSNIIRQTPARSVKRKFRKEMSTLAGSFSWLTDYKALSKYVVVV